MRRCEIDRIGIDLPCKRKVGKHYMKLVSKQLGSKGKKKLWLCDTHFSHFADSDSGYVKDLLDPLVKPDDEMTESQKFVAHFH